MLSLVMSCKLFVITRIIICRSVCLQNMHMYIQLGMHMQLHIPRKSLPQRWRNKTDQKREREHG